ncbi:MAG TPA: DUF2288 domain-containing protein [Gallionella sp.]|nr:DUF2288 domain-containing protein [Gallionella sp.]
MGAPADRGEDIRAKVNRETSRIAWKDLQRQFAGGVTLAVAGDLDLVEVAFQMSADNAVQIRQWMAAGKFGKVSDEQAGIWFEADAQLWAVVVSPWVLVQQVADREP